MQRLIWSEISSLAHSANAFERTGSLTHAASQAENALKDAGIDTDAGQLAAPIKRAGSVFSLPNRIVERALEAVATRNRAVHQGLNPSKISALQSVSSFQEFCEALRSGVQAKWEAASAEAAGREAAKAEQENLAAAQNAQEEAWGLQELERLKREFGETASLDALICELRNAASRCRRIIEEGESLGIDMRAHTSEDFRWESVLIRMGRPPNDREVVEILSSEGRRTLNRVLQLNAKLQGIVAARRQRLAVESKRR